MKFDSDHLEYYEYINMTFGLTLLRNSEDIESSQNKDVTN